MPLLITILDDDKKRRLVGETEYGEQVVLSNPVPCVLISSYQALAGNIEELKQKAGRDVRYFQLAGIENAQGVIAERTVMPYIVYNGERIERK